jgi:hypothetical protein
MSAVQRLPRTQFYQPNFPGIWADVTPHDTNVLVNEAYAILCPTAGSIRVRNTENGADVTLPFQAGQIIPGRFDRIYATNPTPPAGLKIAY